MHSNQRKSCCYKCDDRILGCHSNCERYSKELKENEKNYKGRKENLNIHYSLADLKDKRIRDMTHNKR